MLSQTQLNMRASNKIEAKLFFANKKLQEYELMLIGVISSNLQDDQINKLIESQETEVAVLNHIYKLIETSY